MADRAEAELLQAAVAWADQHPAESLEAAEVFRASGYWGGFGDSAIPIAGPGAPLVAEFSVAEFAAAVGMTTDSGRYYLGQAVELRYRLPRLWRRVVSGDLAGWKARRVAHETISHALTPAAAAHVDRHLAPVAHKIGAAAIDRLIVRGDRPAHARDRRGDPAGRPPTAGTSRSTTSRSPTRAPRGCTGSGPAAR